MRALSIRMPWAYLCARGIKTIENRTWDTQYRSRFYIHAGQKFEKAALQDWRLKSKENGGLLDTQTIVHIAWLIMLWDRGVSGIIGEATLVKVITKSDNPWLEGPFGFCLADAKLYKYIIPCKGRLGFFTPELGQGRISLEERVAELERE